MDPEVEADNPKGKEGAKESMQWKDQDHDQDKEEEYNMVIGEVKIWKNTD